MGDTVHCIVQKEIKKSKVSFHLFHESMYLLHAGADGSVKGQNFKAMKLQYTSLHMRNHKNN